MVLQGCKSTLKKSRLIESGHGRHVVQVAKLYVAISWGKKLISILMRTRLVFAWIVTIYRVCKEKHIGFLALLNLCRIVRVTQNIMPFSKLLCNVFKHFHKKIYQKYRVFSKKIIHYDRSTMLYVGIHRCASRIAFVLEVAMIQYNCIYIYTLHS